MVKKFVVASYDIANDKRRKKIADTLEKYGVRANYSVFECFVTPKQYEQLKQTICEIAKPKTDSILFYTLCRNCIENREYFGNYGKSNNLIDSI